MSYLEDTLINRELVLEFFLAFSRFEFALKLSGYAKGNETYINSNWDRFASDISTLFDRHNSAALESACDLYLTHPPHRQVLVGGTLSWNPTIDIEDKGDSEILIMLVKRVRNNLFHGGKYGAQFHEEVARNEALLRGGMLILDECLRVSPRVKQAFDGALG